MQKGDNLYNLNCFINPKEPLSFVWVGFYKQVYISRGVIKFGQVDLGSK